MGSPVSEDWADIEEEFEGEVEMAQKKINFQVVTRRVVGSVDQELGGDLHPITAAFKLIGYDMVDNDQGGEYEFNLPVEMLDGAHYDSDRSIHFTVTVEVDQ